MNPFTVLGVREDATPKEVAAAYRQRTESASPQQRALFREALLDIHAQYSKHTHGSTRTIKGPGSIPYNSGLAGFEHDVNDGRVLEGNSAARQASVNAMIATRLYSDQLAKKREGQPCECGQPKDDIVHDSDAATRGALPKGAYHRFSVKLKEGVEPVGIIIEQNVTIDICLICDKKKTMKSISPFEERCTKCNTNYFRTDKHAAPIVKMTEGRELNFKVLAMRHRCQADGDCSAAIHKQWGQKCDVPKGNGLCNKPATHRYGSLAAVCTDCHDSLIGPRFTQKDRGIAASLGIKTEAKDDSPISCLAPDCGKQVASGNAMQPFCGKDCYDEYHKTGDWQIPDPTGLGKDAILNVTPKSQEKYRNVEPKNESLDEKAAEKVAKPKKQKVHPTRNPVSHTDGEFKLGVPHHEMVKNIVDKYHAAAHHAKTTGDDSTMREGHQWYERAHNIAKGIGASLNHPHGAAHVGAGLLSAYSAQTEFGLNADHAVTAALNKKAHGGPGSHAMGGHAVSAKKMLHGSHIDDAFEGEKTNSFAHLIADPHNHKNRVCVDRHALSIAVGRKLSNEEIKGKDYQIHSNSKQSRVNYKHVERAYQSAADHLSKHYGHEIAPHQVQATTWIHHQKEHGITNSPRGLGNRNAFRTRSEPKLRTKNHPLSKKDGQLMRTKKNSISLIDHPKNESIFEMEDRILNRLKIVEGIKFADKKLKYLGDDKTAKKQKSIIGGCA